ncbi:MAG: thiamine pyrophosphate-requiring protein [Rhodospirillales bacterium]
MSTGETSWVEAQTEDTGDAIVAAMAAGGIDHLFFTSGSEIGFFQEATAKARAKGHNALIRLITVPHEHASLNAALGFAAVAGRPAATAAHVDCGTMHYGGAIHTAWRSGLPVVMTAGFPPTAYAGTMKGSRDEGGHLWMQETYDQNGIVRNYTKWDHRLAWQDNPGMIVSRAIQVARSEPCGPVYLSFPKELTFLPAKNARFPSADQLGIPRPAAPDADAIAEIAERLARARHPVAVVSGSGRNPESVPALAALCELVGMAAVDSVQKGYLCLPLRHPMYQGQPSLSQADVVLVVDAEVPWVPNRNAPPADAWIAAIGQDSIKLRTPSYEFTADVRINADPTRAIRALTAAVKSALTAEDRNRIAERSAKLAAASKARFEEFDRDAVARGSSSPIDPLWVSYNVNKILDDNCILLDDTLPGPRVRDFVGCSRPGSYFANPGSSGGWGPGAALGAKLAAPDRDIIVTSGDGFYMFGTPAPALWSAAHHGAPFMVVVYTNRSYTTGTTRVKGAYGEGSYAAKAGFEGGYFDPPIDFAKEAEAAGAYGETVRDPAEVAPALKRGLAQIRNGKPAVISIWMKRLEGED